MADFYLNQGKRENIKAQRRDVGLEEIRESLHVFCDNQTCHAPQGDDLVAHSQRQPKTEASLSEIILATECGGSDATSGLVAIVARMEKRALAMGVDIRGTQPTSGNSATYQRMAGNIDIDAGVVIDQGIEVSALAADLFEELVAVCNGKITKAETLGHREMAIFRVGQTF